jgi:hypothetical protein
VGATNLRRCVEGLLVLERTAMDLLVEFVDEEPDLLCRQVDVAGETLREGVPGYPSEEVLVKLTRNVV